MYNFKTFIVLLCVNKEIIIVIAAVRYKTVQEFLIINVDYYIIIDTLLKYHAHQTPYKIERSED